MFTQASKRKTRGTRAAAAASLVKIRKFIRPYPEPLTRRRRRREVSSRPSLIGGLFSLVRVSGGKRRDVSRFALHTRLFSSIYIYLLSLYIRARPKTVQAENWDTSLRQPAPDTLCSVTSPLSCSKQGSLIYFWTSKVEVESPCWRKVCRDSRTKRHPELAHTQEPHEVKSTRYAASCVHQKQFVHAISFSVMHQTPPRFNNAVQVLVLLISPFPSTQY